MLKSIDHIAIAVRDLEAALRVYGQAFGLPVRRVEDVPAEGVKVAFLPLPGGGAIELVQPIKDGTSIAHFLERRGQGIHHLCFEVDDLEASIRDFEKNGAKMIEGCPRAGAHGRVAFFHPETTEGILIELCEV